MARSVKNQQKMINTVIAWTIGLLIFFPVLWTVLTSFKTEGQAINDPPLFLFFDWTLENYAIVQERSDYMKFLWNSIFIAGGLYLTRDLNCRPCGVVDGLCSHQANKRYLVVDAFDENASCRRCSLPNLYWVY